MRNNHEIRFSRRRGSALALVLYGIAALLLIGLALYFAFQPGTEAELIDPILAEVEQGEFVSLVLDQGEVQSSENVEIRCQVKAQSRSLSVIELVSEGTLVKGGDFLVRLDSSGFEQDLESQKITVANAETEVIQAEAALETAKESLKEYEQGVFVERKKQIENDIYDAQSQIETARQELNQAKAVYNHSKKLQGKGFITKQQLEAAKFAVSRNEFALKRAVNLKSLAEKQEEVLVKITKVKETVQLRSDIRAAEVKLINEKESQKVEMAQLEDIKEQIKKCTVVVPEGVQGQVVYAKESSRGGNDWVLEEGTSVRENQVLVRLPNPDKMEVKATINEQSITQIKDGMPVEIKVDALNDQKLKGIVTKVNQYAERSGWGSSSVRKYAAFVRILDPPETLKPGMNASVSIQARYEPEAIKVPIQAVYAVQDSSFCLVKKGENQWDTRPVEVDGDNSQMVLIKSGLEVGEQVVLNPGAYKDIMDLPETKLDTKIEISKEAQDKFDKAQAKELAMSKSGRTNGETAKAERGEGGQGGERGGRGQRGDRQGRGEGGRGGGRGGPSGGGGGGFDPATIVDRMMQRYDTNSDGTIDAGEIANIEERARDRVKQGDQNGDGKVTKQEMAQAMDAMMKRFQGGGGGGRPGGGRGGPGGGS